jgi:hypothetical protein
VPVRDASPNSGLDTDFLLLPAYDIEFAKPQAQGQEIRTGDTVAIKVSGITLPAGVSASDLVLVVPPGNAGLDDQGFAVENVSAANGGAAGAAELKALIVPLKPGKLTLPSLEIATQGDAPKAIGRTNPLPLEVASAIRPSDPKPKEPAPVRPPLMLDFPRWIYYVGGGLLLLVFLGLLYGAYLFSKKERKPSVKVSGPPLTDDEAALAALLEVEKAPWLKSGEFKKHAFRISEVLKNYIGARYGFDAPECTTRELFLELENLSTGMPGGSVPPERLDREALKNLFDKLDRVKFTDDLPTLSDASRFTQEAREFVLKTRRRVMAAGISK